MIFIFSKMYIGNVNKTGYASMVMQVIRKCDRTLKDM